MTLAPADRARLREAAMAATPGPWKWNRQHCRPNEPPNWLYSPGGTVFGADWTDERLMVSKPDARHIAAADPSTVLAVLDALDAAERERDEARAALALATEFRLGDDHAVTVMPDGGWDYAFYGDLDDEGREAPIPSTLGPALERAESMGADLDAAATVRRALGAAP